jgi:hypothetical protein
MPPFRRPLGRDALPACLGRVNLGDLIGQRPAGICSELTRRGIQVRDDRDAGGPAEAIAAISGGPPIFCCGDTVDVLWVDDACLGHRVIGFAQVQNRRATDYTAAVTTDAIALTAEPASEPPHPLMQIRGMTQRRVELLAARDIRSVDDLAHASDAELQPVFRAQVDAVREQARSLLAREEGEPPATPGAG